MPVEVFGSSDGDPQGGSCAHGGPQHDRDAGIRADSETGRVAWTRCRRVGSSDGRGARESYTAGAGGGGCSPARRMR